jgi:hypothetical protein
LVLENENLEGAPTVRGNLSIAGSALLALLSTYITIENRLLDLTKPSCANET